MMGVSSPGLTLMNEVFNTPFEISLRMALLFGTCDNAMTSDRAAALDFITIYSNAFHLTQQSINGENDYGFSEFATRRELVNQALKNMVIDGLMVVHRDEFGFQYALSTAGKNFRNSLKSEYAREYSELATITVKRMKNRSDVELLALITHESTQSLRR